MLKHILLGLLQNRPRHGYELKLAIEEMTGGTWLVNEGQVYATLGRLEKAGLVSASTVEQALLPNRRVYDLTAGGRLALKRWLAEPADEPVRLQEEWFVKVLVQLLVAPERWDEVVGVQRESGVYRLAELTDIRDDPETPPVTRLVVEGAMLQLRAGLEWLDVCEDYLSSQRRGRSRK
jgi:DNA-binding PadR family transcriptional regulator